MQLDYCLWASAGAIPQFLLHQTSYSWIAIGSNHYNLACCPATRILSADHLAKACGPLYILQA